MGKQEKESRLAGRYHNMEQKIIQGNTPIATLEHKLKGHIGWAQSVVVSPGVCILNSIIPALPNFLTFIFFFLYNDFFLKSVLLISEDIAANEEVMQKKDISFKFDREKNYDAFSISKKELT